MRETVAAQDSEKLSLAHRSITKDSIYSISCWYYLLKSTINLTNGFIPKKWIENTVLQAGLIKNNWLPKNLVKGRFITQFINYSDPFICFIFSFISLKLLIRPNEVPNTFVYVFTEQHTYQIWWVGVWLYFIFKIN